jgi:putative phosphotransacetylase
MINIQDKQDMELAVRAAVLAEFADQKLYYIPAAVSNRHVHLSKEHIQILFGADFKLNSIKKLSQPGQYACNETVLVQGPKGGIGKVRVLGPARPESQVEISITDSFVLGIKPAVRLSGDLAGTPGCVIVGPAGQVQLDKGVIVSLRHVHLSTEQGKAYGLKSGDIINLKKSGPRGIILNQVHVRCGEGHELELHIDTDEANAANIKNGDYLEIV